MKSSSGSDPVRFFTVAVSEPEPSSATSWSSSTVTKEVLEQAREDNIQMIVDTINVKEIMARQKELKKLATAYRVSTRTSAKLFMNRASIKAISNGFIKPYENTKYQLCEFDVRRDLHDI